MNIIWKKDNPSPNNSMKNIDTADLLSKQRFVKDYFTNK